MKQFTYEDPGQIDGDPAEVEAQVRDQLAGLADLFAELASESYVQLRSSWMSNALEQARDVSVDFDPDALAEAWDESSTNAKATRLIGASQAVRNICHSL